MEVNFITEVLPFEGTPAQKQKKVGVMLPELLQKISLFFLLHCIDVDLAREQQLARCPYCGGPLHHSSYQRKPRGGSV